MMRPCVLLLLALSALVCSGSARQVAFAGASLPNQIYPSQFQSAAPSAPYASRTNVAKCYGLARKSRTRSLQVPVLYNSVSGQTAAVPDYLFSLDDKTIDRLEAEGWEVRMKTMLMPDTFYQRVPVCCPWDTACYHNQQRGGVQMTMPQPASRTMGPCMNGGVLTTRGRTQVCVCPSGYQGVWCQTPTMMTSSIPSSFPSGPVIPYGRMGQSNADIMKQAVKQAQMWREKMMSAKQPGVVFAGRPLTKRPLLSPNDHIITSIHKQWAQQKPLDRANQMKMAMIMNWYRQQQGQRMGNMPQGRVNPMMMATPVFKGQDPRRNMYSASQPQPFVNPQMVAMINHLQGRARMPAPINAYGQQPHPMQHPYARGGMAMNQGPNVPQARTPWDMDPWERQRGNGRGQAMMGGPSSSVSREKLMALAFTQYMKNVQRQLAIAQASGRGDMMQPNMGPQINRRVPVREPPMTDVYSDYASNPAMMAGANNIPPYQSDQTPNTDKRTNQGTDGEMTSVELPGPVGIRDKTVQQQGPLNHAHGPMRGQGVRQLTDNGPINPQEMPMGGMNGPPMPQGMNPMDGQMLQGMPMGARGPMPMGASGQMPMGASGQMPMGASGQMPGQMPMGPGGAMPKMPSQEELQKMTQCRVVLEPRINMCIRDAGHDISLEQFMNPQYMSAAKGVCEDSETVGHCVMRQDQACGEGESVEMTKKMIDSVLQMMGMVCGQIMKIEQQRANQVGPVPGMPQSNNSPSLTPTFPHGSNTPAHTDTDTSPVGEAPAPTTVPTINVRLHTSGNSEAPPMSFHKFTTSKIGSAVTDRTPSRSASKSENGHHSVEPITSESFIPGAPLWIVILVASIVLLISCLSLVLIALAVRKRRVEKFKEIERKAEPMDPKMFAIGIPPPNYATASIKTQDEFCLPPLDLVDNTSGKGDSDGGEGEEDDDDDIKKPAISDDDADDESDEKEEDTADKKKKEKKEKK